MGFLLLTLLALTVYVNFFRSTTAQSKHQHTTSTATNDMDTNAMPSGYSLVHIDPSRVQLVGVTTEKIEIRNLKKIVRTVGIIEVDETRQAIIQTKFKGWIEALYADFVGMPVKKGQRLFSVYSPELLVTQEELLIALADGNSDLIEAVRQRLKLLDICTEEIVDL